MRKLIVTEFLTLDGVYEEATPWRQGYRTEDSTFKRDELFDAGALLLGRVTYEGFARYWPNATETGAFGERMNHLPKFVATTTLTDLSWNATPLHGDVVEAVQTLKAQDGGHLLTYGSGTFVQTLLRHGLVDELRLMMYPVVLGSGKRLFGGGDRLTMQLASSKELGDGVLLLTYVRDTEARGDQVPSSQ
ncbi:dihydrofolate reductase family protein [Deinococcus sonorensis]|uniref:Dihydrofolate reductase family protein n=2 Tax=Deinococcus sonorensis TaxID=309891 RepID=A0AAU7U5F8_9DEIO